MRLASYWERLQYKQARSRRPQNSRRPLALECLEERTVPTILWGSPGSRVVVDGGGLVLPHVDVDLVFWGSGWNSAQALMNNVINSMTTILNGPFMSALSQYRGIGNGQLLRTDLITSTSPAAQLRNVQFDSFVKTSLNNGSLPVTPNMDSQILYMVIPQPGTTDPLEQITGAHSWDQSNVGRFFYAWSESIIDPNINELDDTTVTLSHELAESATDPMPFTAFYVPSTGDEICDGDAENYNYRLNGVMVQSILSQKDQAYAVYDGNTQNFVLTNAGVLMVNGDQLPNANDTITITTIDGGYQVDLNGEVVQFDKRDFFTGRTVVSSITVNTGTGNDTVNIEGAVSGLLLGFTVVTVNLGDGTDTVNFSPAAQDLSNVSGAVTVNGGSGSGTLKLYDANNTSDLNYILTSSTVARLGMATVTYHKLANLALTTSSGNDTIFIKGTAAGTAVAVTGGGGNDTLVGSTAADTWNLTGSNSGLLSSAMIAGPVSFTAVQSLSGQGGNDTFLFSDGAGITGNLDGGSGKATLDYAAYSSSVLVDLQTGTATGVGGSIAHIDNVIGGTGGGAGIYNILVGNGGNMLSGGNGRRNLLIAGASASTLNGGDDEDILIGGTTAYDLNLSALQAIMNYWSGSSDDYATRVGTLLSGSGVPLLDATTVTSNGGGNTLTGGPGVNLYYANTADTTDFDPNSGAVLVAI